MLADSSRSDLSENQPSHTTTKVSKNPKFIWYLVLFSKNSVIQSICKKK